MWRESSDRDKYVSEVKNQVPFVSYSNGIVTLIREDKIHLFCSCPAIAATGASAGRFCLRPREAGWRAREGSINDVDRGEAKQRKKKSSLSPGELWMLDIPTDEKIRSVLVEENDAMIGGTCAGMRIVFLLLRHFV